MASLGDRMTLSEFKFWYEGYKESFVDGLPNKEQLSEIERRIEEINPVTPFNPVYYPVWQPEKWNDWSLPPATCGGSDA